MSKEKIISFPTNDSKLYYTFKKGKYIKTKILGEGSFGKVVLVEKVDPIDKSDSKSFAIKISKRFKKASKKAGNSRVLLEEDEKPKELNFIEIRELVIMKKINHPNLMNLKDFKYCKEDREIWILMEYMPIDLGKFFLVNRDNKEIMNEKFFKNIAFQILSGLNYLHQKMIIHRDLKLENILYDEEKKLLKITDFGLSRQFDYDISTQYTDVGTYPYKPPELILGLTHYSTSFDIWSLGCILVEICTGTHLFGENDALGVIKLMYKIFGTFNDSVLPGFRNFPSSKLLEGLPQTEGIGLINYIKSKVIFGFENDNFFDLIEKMLCIDPTKRINAKECLSHSWFADIYV